MTLATYQSEEMMGPGHRYPGSTLRYSPPLSLSESTPTHTDHTEGTPSFTASSPSCSSDVLGTVLTTVAWESPPLLPSLLSSHTLLASRAWCCPPPPAAPHLSFPLACLHGAFCLSVCLSLPHSLLWSMRKEHTRRQWARKTNVSGWCPKNLHHKIDLNSVFSHRHYCGSCLFNLLQAHKKFSLRRRVPLMTLFVWHGPFALCDLQMMVGLPVKVSFVEVWLQWRHQRGTFL